MFRILFSIPLLFSFLINSLAQTKINSLDISGNNYFTSYEINNLMLTKKDGIFKEEQFLIDLKTVRDRYKTSGFLYIKFDDEKIIFSDDSSFVDIKLKINEGNKVTVGKIEIEGANALKKKDILKNFDTKIGENLNDNTLNDDISGLLKTYEKLGLPFAKINVKDISVYKDNGNDKIKIDLSVTENSKVKIDQIKIKGNQTTKDYVILRELNIDKNKTINSETTKQMKERLDRLNIFESVSDPRIYSLKNKNESGLLIEVTEGNTNTFDGVLGYVPPSGANKGYFTGLVNVSFRNLFGTGRKLEAKYDQIVSETQELEFKYFEPYFFSLPLNINFGFLQRIQDSTYTKRNLDLRGDFLFSNKFTLSAIGGYERVIPSDITDPAYVIADSRILSTGIELKYDTRDNIFIPAKGFLYKTSYTYGNKRIFNWAQLQSLGYQEVYSIQRLNVDLDFYFSFVKRQTILLKLLGGEVQSEKLENSDYYRIGGNKYIRGYRNEQFLASRVATENLELRYSISKKGFLFVFYDAGYYFLPPDITNNIPEQSGFLHGYGLGIRLETGLGLIGVSYALGKDDGLLEGNLHFGLINDF
jgi:outer membrane protein insertion porin family